MRTWLVMIAFFTMGLGLSAQGATFPPRPLQFLQFHDVRAYVTGYNTVPGQTDDTPCIAASGANICGRTDAVACPRRISLGTYLAIRGVFYVCEDRLAKKFDSRFDISCDKDTNCPGQVTGWAEIVIFSEDLCRLRVTAPVAVTAAMPRRVATAWHPVRYLRGRMREWPRA